MRDSEMYNAHAARSHQEAEDATLANVRDRALRSEAAWSQLARRSEKSEAAREAREARPVEEIAPEIFTA